MPAPRKLKVMLVAEEAAGVRMFRALTATSHDIVAVLTSVSEKPGETSLASVAKQQGHKVWPASLVKEADLAKTVRGAGIDLLLNIHSRHIICDEVLKATRIGAFNVHPGPLPKYAGLNSTSWAIFSGEQTYGVTVHWMEREIDTGAIAYKALFPLWRNDTPVTLTHKCITNGIPLVLQLLSTASQDEASIPRQQQNLMERYYHAKEVPDDGRLCWNRSASEVVNFVRACEYWPYPSPWGHPRTRLGDREFAVTKAAPTDTPCTSAPGTVGSCDQEACMVAATDEWVALHQLKLGGQSVRPQDILRPGDILSDEV